MLIGAEAAVRDADKAEEQARLQAEVRVITTRAAEAVVIDEAIWAEGQADSKSGSEVAEVVFTTQISPPRQSSMLPPSTPEALRKRTLTLVDRTPEKPRAPPAPVINLATINSAIPEVDPELAKAQEDVASTAPARLDRRPRREGKNTEYNRAMVIERGPGRERGRRGGKT
jgi:hypothetical protein